MACYSRSTLPWPLPSTSHPLTSLHTWESEQQRLMEKKPSEDPARPACPAAPHSLNELQPLLDVRLPSLPLHQSLGERAVYPLVSSGRGLVTIPTPLWALSFPHSSHFAGAPIGHGPFHSLQTPCEPSHAAPALHAHAPLDCFVRCLGQGLPGGHLLFLTHGGWVAILHQTTPRSRRKPCFTSKPSPRRRDTQDTK